VQDYFLHLSLQTYTYVPLDLTGPGGRTRPEITIHVRRLRQDVAFLYKQLYLSCKSKNVEKDEFLKCIYLGKVKYGTPTRCNSNNFIDLQDQLNMFRANFCPSSGAQD
jgi:hypothetical protein